MTSDRHVWLCGVALGAAAVMIWWCDLAWMVHPADSLPLAMGFLLAWWLGRPWCVDIHPLRGAAVVGVVASIALLVLGWLSVSGWSCLVMGWVSGSFAVVPRRMRMGWLLVFSFPWLMMEWPSLGWWFRLSSTTCVACVFDWLRLPVEHAGTSLRVLGLPIEIEAGCAGWNLLQLSLLCGTFIGAREIERAKSFAVFMVVLPLMAWFANAMRILLLCGLALSSGVDLASGAIHHLLGLAAVVIMLVIAKGICHVLNPPMNVVVTNVCAS